MLNKKTKRHKSELRSVCKMNNWLRNKQKFLGTVGTFTMLIFTCFVTPFSLDMYTPALPQMVVFFNSDVATVNLTILCFYVFFAAGQLILGSLSDNVGRKPILIGGSIVYSVGSLACFMSQDIIFLLISRIIQAIGAGAIAAVGIAMTKDLFKPEKLDAALSIVTSIFGIGPIAAPLFGALLMQVAGWHAIFAALFVFGLICLLFGLFLQEPLSPEERTEGQGLKAISGLWRVLKNKAFTIFMCVMAILDVAFMAYISVVSHIYVTFFGLDEVGYGIYFGVGMMVMLVGPVLWPFASKIMNRKSYVWVLLGAYVLAGVLLISVGSCSPVAFCTIFALLILAESSSRPFSMAIMLAQQNEDAGAAGSLANCSRTVFGTIGMAVAVLPWDNFIFGLGVITLVSIASAVVLWILLLRGNFDLRGVK